LPFAVSVVVDVRGAAEVAGGPVRAALPLSRAACEREPETGCEAAGGIDAAGGAIHVEARVLRVAGAHASELRVEAEIRRAVFAHQLTIELDTGARRIALVGRDLRSVLLPQGAVARLDRFDPKWVTLTDPRSGESGTLMIDDTVDGVVVRPGVHATQISLELEAAEARPFVHDARCTARWRDQNRHLPVAARLLTIGDRLGAHGQWITGPALPLLKAHFPDGRRAALVVSDHADQSSARTLAALAEGLAAHHLAITKALFAHGADRPQLEDPKVVTLADELNHAGSEIVPHSATPRPDERAVTEAALEQFERWHARTWIDHQPETNCEAFGDEGYRVGGRFGIADLLSSHGYRYVWAEVDAKAGDLNLLHPGRLAERAPTVWPVGRLDRGSPADLWMFRSVWSFLEAKRFYAMYGPRALDRLEVERGLHIAHTYLETYHPKGTRFGRRNLLIPADPAHDQPGGAGPVRLDPRFDALLGELEERQARGTLWVPTVAELGDRLRATAEVTIALNEEGSARVRTPEPLPGATFVVPTETEVRVGGRPPRSLTHVAGETTFIVDLPAGDTMVTLTSPAGEPRSFFGLPKGPDPGGNGSRPAKTAAVDRPR
jgi:hypothetical protein